MDTTALRGSYDRLLDVAAIPDLGDAADGGWNADQILAHILSVDAGIASVALGVVSGARPAFDNRISLDTWNLDRIIAEHSGRVELIDHVRSQATVLCDIADQLHDTAAAVLVPSFLLSNDALVLDQPIPLADLIDGLAENHVPAHTRQLLDLRVPGNT
ncbi:hypothetical protein H0B56_15945 [Haloechinothrix sp. YIM 98757]|uniref:DinB superfamily protein n=1 Tax=Haloechinothrix aidingensis TaxID=2752311 RepID=A0A838ACU5_9PSEU|nr:hypothetical protein [Haloechinothrix aidingensis]MBA0127043.1 hypothetical protein [Haloechinothrix aidingensis]